MSTIEVSVEQGAPDMAEGSAIPPTPPNNNSLSQRGKRKSARTRKSQTVGKGPSTRSKTAAVDNGSPLENPSLPSPSVATSLGSRHQSQERCALNQPADPLPFDLDSLTPDQFTRLQIAMQTRGIEERSADDRQSVRFNTPPHRQSDQYDCPRKRTPGMESAVSMASNSEAMRHSIKLADPAKLSDGQDPTFERWKNSTQRKLRTNWWLFPSEESKFDWLCTLVDGEAAVMLEPFICEDNAEPLTTVEEVYELLRSSYSNPDAVAEARDELYHLWMKDTEDFYSFCSRWVLLASKAGLARSEWKYELNRKLSPTLRLQVMSAYLDPKISFNDFRNKCSSHAQQLAEVERVRKQRQGSLKATSRRPFVPGTRSQETGKASPTKVLSYQKIDSTPLPVREAPGIVNARPSAAPERRRDTRSRTPNKTEGVTCYSCDKPGHIAPNCPDQSTPKVNFLENDGRDSIDPGQEGPTSDSESENFQT
ncbi:hypothetical protein NPX13_g9880 [Xylaria arbuscula]|uniref:CCHC-type domain-containing protein n=1 Tax=Xylaria arbuscula TaxID=114810 RepID=A0A9W8N5K1_9PEZI|nr:hypothetical protein NPX13_g9880 [Xylaria arbuscula]